MRKLISLALAVALSCVLLAVPSMADETEAEVITSANVSMEDRAEADIAAEDAAAMADAGLNTNVAASTAPTEEQAAADEAAAGVPSQPEEGPAVTPPVQVVQMPYTDVTEDNPFYHQILYVTQHDLFRGFSDSSFRPDGRMTRAMFVTVLYRQAAQLSQDMKVQSPSAFTDIAASNAEFQTAINWAAERGIVNGKTAETFAPNETVSRQQACAIIVRYLRDFLKLDLSAFQAPISFADAAQISGYAVEPVTIAVNMSLIDASASAGDGQKTFTPWGAASRGVVAKVMAVATAKLPDLKKAPEPVAPVEPVTPVTPAPSSGSSGSSGSKGGGGSSGGGGSVTPAPTPATPDPATPDPAPVTHTAEELEAEATAIGYMQEFVDKYESYIISNANVRGCFEVLIPTLKDAIAAHNRGEFVDRDYAVAHYNTQAGEFRSRYNALTDSEKSSAQQYALIFANTTRKAQTIMEFFGVTEAALG